jgi:SSS family solute:Na+ symporter
MEIFGLALIDVIVIGVYLLVLIGIGIWASTRIKSREDFFLGGRRFGKIIQVFAAFGQATSAETGPSVTTTTANNGASGIWSALMMLFSTPSYWLTGPWYRRMRVLTMGDYFTERFSSKMLGGIYSLMASISLMLLLTVGFIGMTKTVLVMTPKDASELTTEERVEYNQAQRLEALEAIDYEVLTNQERQELEQLRSMNPRKVFSHLDKNTLILIMVVVIILYSVAGGLEAAFISDMMQGIFIIMLSIILIPFAFIEINNIYGGESFTDAFTILHDQLPESFFEIFGSPNSIDFTWYYITALGIMATINVAAGANQLVATASAKNEYAARFGLTYGTYLKRLTTVLWGLTALAVILLFGDAVSDPDLLWGYASRELLGKLNIGLIGLMIAALMAALMSTADMMMLTCSGLITHNLYRPFRQGKSEMHYVWVGRILGASIVIGAALIVMVQDDLFNQLKFFWEWGVVFSAGFWMGILWRRTNRKGVWYSIMLTFIIFFLLPLILPMMFSNLRTNDYLLSKTDERIVERTYTAHKVDVEVRNQEIALWEQLDPENKLTTPKPEVIQEGEKFAKTYKLPQKSIFWTQGIKMDEQGSYRGQGLLNLELILLDKLGFNLRGNPYALNETLRIIFRTIFPFLIIILFGYISRHTKTEQRNIELFYAKMKTRVQDNREKDQQEVQLSYAQPHRFDHRKMFPHSQWEVLKWSRTDATGFILALFMVVAILGFLYVVINLGGKIPL